MSKDTDSHRSIPTQKSSSALDRLNLSFEYNVTWADEKRLVKERTE